MFLLFTSLNANEKKGINMTEIKKIFLIKDITTNKFFGTYRVNDYWTNNVNDATEFMNEDEALVLIQDEERFGDFFMDKHLSIEKNIKIK